MDAFRYTEMPLDWLWTRHFFTAHGRQLRNLWHRHGDADAQHLGTHEAE